MQCPLLVAERYGLDFRKSSRIECYGRFGWLCVCVDAAGHHYASVRWDLGGYQGFNRRMATDYDQPRRRPRRLVSFSQRLITGESEWMGVYPYPSHGRRYWRYQWGVGRRSLGQKHIPGGGIENPVAKARANEVARWIRQGRSRAEILKLIESWRKPRADGSKSLSR